MILVGGLVLVATDKVIEVWTDGACRGNQNSDKSQTVGGWGVLLKYDDYERQLCSGEVGTTNNRMEMTAVIKGLEAINRTTEPVVVFSDSNYIINGVSKWIAKWNLDSGKVKNSDLWKEILKQKNRFSNIKFVKVAGHAGVECNEIADKLANRGADLYQRRVSNL